MATPRQCLACEHLFDRKSPAKFEKLERNATAFSERFATMLQGDSSIRMQCDERHRERSTSMEEDHQEQSRSVLEPCTHPSSKQAIDVATYQRPMERRDVMEVFQSNCTGRASHQYRIDGGDSQQGQLLDPKVDMDTNKLRDLVARLAYLPTILQQVSTFQFPQFQKRRRRQSGPQTIHPDA